MGTLSKIIAGVSILHYLNRLNNITAPAGNMGIVRQQMPQIEKKDVPALLHVMHSNGIGYKIGKTKVSDLRLAQNEYNSSKVHKLMGLHSHDPIFVSKDGFVIDGSHRFLAAYNTDKQSSIETTTINLPIKEALDFIRKSGYATYRNFSDAKVASK